MITKFKLFESRMSDDDIHRICKKYNIENYVINPDGSISVNGNVSLSHLYLEKMPLKFKDVSGYFICYNNKLTSLEGCPETVGCYFNCYNNKLTSLEGCPKSVGDGFYCHNNRLTSLEGCPDARTIYCTNNQITSFDGLPEFWEKDVYINGNPVDEIYQLFNRDPKCIEWIREYDVIQGDKVSKHRLEEVFHTLNLEVPKNHVLRINLKNYKLI